MNKRILTVILVITAALVAAVVANRITADYLIPGLFLADYSEPHDKTVSENGITVIQKGRRITVSCDGRKIWALSRKIKAQDFLLDDIDHDGDDELLILCWKRGRFGEHKPTWIEEDEKWYSQHIFIYEFEGEVVRPKWMASDIGMEAVAIRYEDGVLEIEDTDGRFTYWMWKSWGLEKL